MAPARFLEWLFPVPCVGCGLPAPGLCPDCLGRAAPAPDAPPPPGIDEWYAPFAYEGVVREAVARLKYRNARAALGTMVAFLDRAIPARLDVGAVTWVPTTVLRRRARGFDHGHLLATAIARRRGAPTRLLLGREDALAQTGRDREGRSRGPVFRAVGRSPRSVLIVDDVATSGASLRNAAATLRREGCERVIGATVARTVLKGPLRPSEKA